MTTNIELAKRAVVCPGFRHVDGMQWIHIDALKNGRNAGWDKSRGSSTSSAEEFRAYGWLPNLDDWGTLGCIEHGLLPELWPECAITVLRWVGIDGKTYADVDVRELVAPCQMRFGAVDVPLAEGLVAALEAAPAKAVQG